MAIPAAELLRIQADAYPLVLVQSCDILRLTATNDPEGGESKGSADYIAVQTNIPCAVLPAGAMERYIAEQLAEAGSQTLLLPGATDVRKTDRIKVYGFGTYHVIGLIDPTTYEIFRRVLAAQETIPVT